MFRHERSLRSVAKGWCRALSGFQGDMFLFVLRWAVAVWLEVVGGSFELRVIILMQL